MESPNSPFANLSNDELEDQITELTGHLNAANEASGRRDSAAPVAFSRGAAASNDWLMTPRSRDCISARF
ncbi:MAG: hypothetical protein QOF42_1882 [Gammaproteobacteria bacterium]|jgi:hypothetical protein|nr:hypothetical protein [Gammaproteobacteria bacterium]